MLNSFTGPASNLRSPKLEMGSTKHCNWMVGIVSAGVAGARFRPAIPAVILVLLHSGWARGLGSVRSPTGGSGRRVRAVYEVWCSGFILSSLIKALVNDYGHLDIRNMLVKVFWSSPCLACTHIVRMLNTTPLFYKTTNNELISK